MGIENEIELDLMVLHRQKWGKMEIYRPKRAIYSNVYIYTLNYTDLIGEMWYNGDMIGI